MTSFADGLLARLDFLATEAGDPVDWIGDRLDAVTWSRQRDIARSVWRNPRTAVQASHSVGKSCLAARINCAKLDNVACRERSVKGYWRRAFELFSREMVRRRARSAIGRIGTKVPPVSDTLARIFLRGKMQTEVCTTISDAVRGHQSRRR